MYFIIKVLIYARKKKMTIDDFRKKSDILPYIYIYIYIYIH
jgi:hypothetical protein